MTHNDELIAGAAEIIVSEETKRGGSISLPEAVHLAKTLYEFWVHPHIHVDIPPGDVARRFRERYQEED